MKNIHVGIDLSVAHDAELLKVELKDNGVELFIKLINKSIVTVTLDSVERMLCDSFREGNIILSVDVLNDTLSWNFSTLLAKLFELNEQEKKENPAYFLKTKEKINNQELVLFHISPSYGCELIALCKDVVINGVKLNETANKLAQNKINP
ncbi:hypothetical protein DOJK_01467 [Patescibacteria group bacterium]|nr:hypothetical protein DOJK_01467 [Patescibacteria group bacterium]